jgi:hypothetical protein
MARDLRYTATSVAFDESGEGAQGTHDVYEANHLWPGGEGSAVVCDVCGDEFRGNQVREFRGKLYGIPCGCADEIRGILMRERADEPPAVRGEERESRMLT